MRRAALLTMVLTGCGVEPAPEVETLGGGVSDSPLLEELIGAWQVEAFIWSDCPEGWSRAMPTGTTLWSSDSGQLVIEAMSGASEAISLWPVDAWSLMGSTTITVPGCSATETLTLELDAVDDQWASGRYSAILQHDGSVTCQQLAAQATLPDQCQTEILWQARRL